MLFQQPLIFPDKRVSSGHGFYKIPGKPALKGDFAYCKIICSRQQAFLAHFFVSLLESAEISAVFVNFNKILAQSPVPARQKRLIIIPVHA